MTTDASRSTPGALLAWHVKDRPQATACIEHDVALTYAALHDRVHAAQAWLQAQGVGSGDVVAVWLVNRTEWLTLWLALARLGATLAAVNTRYRVHELEHILARSGASLLILQSTYRQIDFLGIASRLDRAAVPQLQRLALVDAAPASPTIVQGMPVLHYAPVDADPQPDVGLPDAACVLYTTSGTTSKPKLVVHTQETLALHARRAAAGIGLHTPDSVLLAALPLCGTFGLTGAAAALAAGRPIVLLDAFEPDAAARLIRRHAVTHVFGSDEMVRRLLDAVPEPTPFPSLRLFGFASFHSGAETLVREATERGIPLAGLYGSSEVHALFALQPQSLALADRAAGGGLPVSLDANLRVRDMDTQALLPPGRTGMLEIQAPTNFVGYLGDPAATAAAIDDEGFFRTGDVGHLRGDGSFVYEARLGDAMRLGGFLVNPVEIEEALQAQPGVEAAQVVAVDVGGQPRAVAFVVPEAGAMPDVPATLARLKTSLAGFKVPVRMWVVDALPVTESANGTKIQRARLRDMALAHLQAESASTPATQPEIAP